MLGLDSLGEESADCTSGTPEAALGAVVLDESNADKLRSVADAMVFPPTV